MNNYKNILHTINYNCFLGRLRVRDSFIVLSYYSEKNTFLTYQIIMIYFPYLETMTTF